MSSKHLITYLGMVKKDDQILYGLGKYIHSLSFYSAKCVCVCMYMSSTGGSTGLFAPAFKKVFFGGHFMALVALKKSFTPGNPKKFAPPPLIIVCFLCSQRGCQNCLANAHL